MDTRHLLMEHGLGKALRYAKTDSHRVEKAPRGVVAAGYLILAALLTLTILGIAVLGAVG